MNTKVPSRATTHVREKKWNWKRASGTLGNSAKCNDTALEITNIFIKVTLQHISTLPTPNAMHYPVAELSEYGIGLVLSNSAFLGNSI